MTLTESLEEMYGVYQSIRSLPFRERSNWLGNGNTGIPFARSLATALQSLPDDETAGEALRALPELRSSEQAWTAMDESFATLLAE